jgi:hypothetical protein
VRLAAMSGKTFLTLQLKSTLRFFPQPLQELLHSCAVPMVVSQPDGMHLLPKHPNLFIQLHFSTVCYERRRFRDDYCAHETNLDAFRETRPSLKSRGRYRGTFRLPNFILHCTSNFAAEDPTARMDSSTPSQILGDITFGSDRSRRWLALLDPPSARQPEHTRRLSRSERYRGIIGIQSQENRSICRQFDV